MSKINYESFAINAFNHARHNLDEYEDEENWVVANRIFKCGSGNAISFCHELGIDPDGYGPAKNENSDSWISVDDTENLPEENESVLVNVRSNYLKYCFVDIGRYEFDADDNVIWSTNLGLDKNEEVTHFNPNITVLEEVPFSEITD